MSYQWHEGIAAEKKGDYTTFFNDEKHKKSEQTFRFLNPVTHVWVHGAKTTELIAKKVACQEKYLQELSVTPMGYFTEAMSLPSGTSRKLNHSRGTAVSHRDYFAWRKWGISEQHAPQIILWAFTGTSAIAPVSW
jgi:hypothetical protein